jgi:hypothetical protein
MKSMLEQKKMCPICGSLDTFFQENSKHSEFCCYDCDYFWIEDECEDFENCMSKELAEDLISREIKERCNDVILSNGSKCKFAGTVEELKKFLQEVI